MNTASKYLLEAGADPNVIEGGSVEKHTALHLAAYYNHPGLVALLLKHGADPKITTQSAYDFKDKSEGKTPLHRLVEGQHTDNLKDTRATVKALVKAGLDVDQKDDRGLTALTLAVGANHPEAVLVLLQCKANAKETYPSGETLLHHANTYKDKRISNLLKQYGAKIDRGPIVDLTMTDV